MTPRTRDRIRDLGLCLAIGAGYAVLIYMGMRPY